MIGTLINIFNYVYHNYYIYQYRTDIECDYIGNIKKYKWKYNYDEELVLYYLRCEDNYSQNILIPALVRKHYNIVKYIISKNNMMSKYYMDYFINLDYNIFIEIINISSKENINNIFKTLLHRGFIKNKCVSGNNLLSKEKSNYDKVIYIIKKIHNVELYNIIKKLAKDNSNHMFIYFLVITNKKIYKYQDDNLYNYNKNKKRNNYIVSIGRTVNPYKKILL